MPFQCTSSTSACISGSEPALRAVISKQEVSQYNPFDFGEGLKSGLGEQLSICSVLDVDSMITVPEGTRQHGREHHTEEDDCQHTALFEPIRVDTILEYSVYHSTVKLPNHSDESA